MNDTGWLRNRGRILAAVMTFTTVMFAAELYSNWLPDQRTGARLLLSIIPVFCWLLSFVEKSVFRNRIVSWAAVAIFVAVELYLFRILVYQS